MKHTLYTVGLATALFVSVLSPSLSGRASAAVHAAPATAGVATHAAAFDKTRFLLHMGAAFYAFHHFVYARYRSGQLSRGASQRTRHLVAAGLALLFAYHEVRVAYDIASNSNSRALQALISPLNALKGQMNRVGNRLHGGSYNPSDVQGLNSQVNSLSSQAGGNGLNIRDLPVRILGAA